MSLILTKVLLKGKPLDMIRDATNSDILFGNCCKNVYTHACLHEQQSSACNDYYQIMLLDAALQWSICSDVLKKKCFFAIFLTVAMLNYTYITEARRKFTFRMARVRFLKETICIGIKCFLIVNLFTTLQHSKLAKLGFSLQYRY